MSFAPPSYNAKKADRFASHGSLLNEIERKHASPAPSRSSEGGGAARGKSPARPARASPAPKARPTPVQTLSQQQGETSSATHETGSSSTTTTPSKPRAASAPRQRPAGAALKSPKGGAASPGRAGVSPESAPLGGLASAAGPSSAKASSAFAATSKGRFDGGPGSMYGDASKATPASTFNPNDIDGFGVKPSVVKPSAGFAPTSKGRFDAGPGSMYASAVPTPKKAKKKKPLDELDEKAAEWSKALGLGAVAGAKAAPVLKAVDEQRARAEAEAAEAVVAKEAAEAKAEEAVRKANWITERAESRVAEAEAKRDEAEADAEHVRAEHEAALGELYELRAQLAEKDVELEELRRELKHGGKKVGKSPTARREAAAAVDRRPVRLRGQLDAEAESKAATLEQRKAKREEHWKKVEAERIAKEDKVRLEQESMRLKNAPPSMRGTARSGIDSERRSSRGGSADAVDALKAMALLGASSAAKKIGASQFSSRSAPPTPQQPQAPEPPSEREEASHADEPPSNKPPSKAAARKGKPVAKPMGKPTTVEAAEEVEAMAAAKAEAEVEAAVAAEAEAAAVKAAEAAMLANDGYDDPPPAEFSPVASGRPTGMTSAFASDAEDDEVAEHRSASPQLQLMLGGEGATAAPKPFNPRAYEHLAVSKAAAVDGAASALGRPHEHLFTRERPAALKAPSSLKSKSLDALLDDGSAGLDHDDGLSAAEQAIRAVEALRGAPTPSKLGGLSSSLGSLGSLKLSESFGASGQRDDFLERLSKAEGMPPSPNSMLKAGGAHTPLGRSLMPASPMAMAH